MAISHSAAHFYNVCWSAFALLLHFVTFQLPYSYVIGLLRLLAGQRMFDEIWGKSPMRKLQSLTLLPDRAKLFSIWGQFYQTKFMVDEIYQSKVYDFLFSPEKSFTVLDVGANIGIYALRAAKRVGAEGKVIAVEPESENFKLLIRNIYFNRCSNIVPIKWALSDFEGRSQLHLSAYSGKHSLLAKGSSHVEVPVTTTNSLLNRLRVGRIDIMKIDVEGAELEVLQGSEELLRAKRISKIVVAAYHTPTQATSIEKYLRAFGYEVKSHDTLMEGRPHTFVFAIAHDKGALDQKSPKDANCFV